jgi:hypothetical protein
MQQSVSRNVWTLCANDYDQSTWWCSIADLCSSVVSSIPCMSCTVTDMSSSHARRVNTNNCQTLSIIHLTVYIFCAMSNVQERLGPNYDIYIYIYINCNWVDTRWQQYITHLHTNNTENGTYITIKNN